MRVKSRELHNHLSDYLGLVRIGHTTKIIKNNKVVARLLPPEPKDLDVEILKTFHASLGVRNVLNSVLISREASDS
jgi:antitoxin (DNA-binding transcriptional repressor) of toxin-antitoxin stability system